MTSVVPMEMRRFCPPLNGRVFFKITSCLPVLHDHLVGLVLHFEAPENAINPRLHIREAVESGQQGEHLSAGQLHGQCVELRAIADGRRSVHVDTLDGGCTGTGEADSSKDVESGRLAGPVHAFNRSMVSQGKYTNE